jgi:DNA-binding protein Fis
VKERAVDSLDGAWFEVLERLEEAVIVLDDTRKLRLVNASARRLLGYDVGQSVGGRCRLTTRGVDCENACPLTFALESGLEGVENFATVYRTQDGRDVPLRVTLIPLRTESGAFKGAAEILRPEEPNPGFYLAGSSEIAGELRKRAAEASSNRTDLQIVGDQLACRAVARAVHRLSGSPEELFKTWNGSWVDTNPWPPGTVYADGEASRSLLESQRPDGWRIIVGARSMDEVDPDMELLELPPLEDLHADLPWMIGAWINEIAPSKRATAGALERLVRVARDRGLDRLEEVLLAAVAASGEAIAEEHVPLDGYGTALVDELLQAPNPLAALEERLIREVLGRCEWRMQEAADRLGISRVTLWRKMKDLNIEKSS